MKVHEKGVLPGSDYYFPSPGNLAKSMFFYPICTGEFFCDHSYVVEREQYNSFLLMYIKNGSGKVFYGGKSYLVEKGNIIFLDCYKAHGYSTENGWHTIWLHFDGSNSRAYFELLYNNRGCVFPSSASSVIPWLLHVILKGYRNGSSVPEPIISCHIQRILAELLLISSESKYTIETKNSPVGEAIEYIESNFSNKISLGQISSHIHLSPFYFSRQFRKETGYSPYEYIIKIRLEHARQLLKNTRLPIKEIASRCGFLSESNFVFSFHKNVGISPHNFRNTPF